jgi:hypothetical protein
LPGFVVLGGEDVVELKVKGKKSRVEFSNPFRNPFLKVT